jgi:methylase of polypeptide subunit release factors
VSRIVALARLIEALKQRGYHFITPTPATHARVVARADKQQAQTLRDVFGWSLPFTEALLEPELMALLRDAEALTESADGLLRSPVRISTLGGELYAHSAYPTRESDAVFFGPDSYRFADFIAETLPTLPTPRHIVDIGAGAGVGAMTAAKLHPGACVSLLDINPAALDMARANWRAAGLGEAAFVLGESIAVVPGEIDLVIANPPYIADEGGPVYRAGGDLHGGGVTLRWAQQAAHRLQPGGALVLYSGSAIVDGEDELQCALIEALVGFDVRYHELDPDVFGEELEREAYADVERIAVIGLVAIKR